MKLITSLVLSFFIAFTSFAQLKYEISDPVDISISGWDKLLLMRNGNTVLFHFEHRKGIIVKIFNPEHKEIASAKHLCKILDINALERTFLDGIHEINGEAVLFVTQDVFNKETVIRLRFDGNSARLIEEAKLLESASFQHKTVAFLLKEKTFDNYFLVASTGKQGYTQKQFNINKYNGKHELIGTMPFEIDQEGYDEVILRSVDINSKEGIMVSIELAKIVQYPDIYQRHLVMGYLLPGADKILSKKIELPAGTGSFSTKFTYNPFASKLNLLLTINTVGAVKNGLGRHIVYFKDQQLLIMNEDLTGLKFIPLNNSKVQDVVKSQLGNNGHFNGQSVNMYTNSNGLTTVMYDGLARDLNMAGRIEGEGLKFNIGITQFSDDGGEIFGAVVPVSRLKAHEKYTKIFGRINNREICNFRTFNTKNCFYTLFNDIDKNYDMKLSNLADSVYNCELTNACYYKMDKKKQITRSYLLGEPVAGEYKHIYAGSGDFDEKTNTYATVFLHRKGEKDYTTHIAWCHFDE